MTTSTTSETTDNNGGISPETSTRICTHMNDDHTVSVYAMTKSLLGGHSTHYGKITDAKLKEVSLEGCNIASVTCKGDLCEMKRLIFPFRPPLARQSEIRSRMVEIHQQVCSPNPLWLVTDSFAFGILMIGLLMGYACHILGLEELTKLIENASNLNKGISMIFGSANGFSTAVKYSWMFYIVAHVGEACYVVYQGKQQLKLSVKPLLMWFVLVSSVGWPITKEFLELQTIYATKHSSSSGDSNKKGS